MSVRICHLERGSRGSVIKRVRLVGQTASQVFPAEDAPSGVDPREAARWIRESLSQLRDAGSIAMLCLDTDGSTCAWLSSPSDDPTIINVLARAGGAAAAGDDAPRGHAAFEFYAPTPGESTIEALVTPQARGSAALASLRRAPAAAGAEGPKRMAVLASADVPARLLIDALDDEQVPVEATGSFWHVMAMAWDPGAKAAAAVTAGAGPIQAQTVPGTVATVVIEPRGRLVWCWSRAGELLVGGSMRLRTGVPATTAEDGGEATPAAIFGADEVHRLATEWLSWSVQTGCSPSHVTCVMTADDPQMVSEFGQALGRHWPQTTVDAVMVEDPVLATLSRVAERLEGTPRDGTEGLSARRSMVGLSTRQGRAHRRMYLWKSLAIAGGALLAVTLSAKLRSAANAALEESGAIQAASAALVKEHFPDARPGPGYSLLQATTDEVARLRNLAEPPKRAEPPMPLLEELATLSMVTGDPNYSLENIDLESSSSAVLRLGVVANSLSDAEAMTEALNAIAGSAVLRWEEPASYDTTSRPGKFRINYTAKWAPRADKGGAKPAGGGS